MSLKISIFTDNFYYRVPLQLALNSCFIERISSLDSLLDQFDVKSLKESEICTQLKYSYSSFVAFRPLRRILNYFRESDIRTIIKSGFSIFSVKL